MNFSVLGQKTHKKWQEYLPEAVSEINQKRKNKTFQEQINEYYSQDYKQFFPKITLPTATFKVITFLCTSVAVPDPDPVGSDFFLVNRIRIF